MIETNRSDLSKRFNTVQNLEQSRVVSKFGGTSMADARAMLQSAKVCLAHKSKIVVVSATSGTTNALLEIGQKASAGRWEEAEALINEVKARHLKIAADLASTDDEMDRLRELIQELEALSLGIWLLKESSPRASDNLVSIGERLSSILFMGACRLQGLNPKFLDARQVIVTDSQFGKAHPLVEKTKDRARTLLLPDIQKALVFVTQGFIGATESGVTTTLGRGGSDYSAALFVGSSRVDLQACKLEYSIVSPK